MPEPKAGSDVLRAGTPVTVGAVTLLPIERVVTHARQSNSSVWFSVSKEPLALVIRDADGIRAIETDTAHEDARIRRESLRRGGSETSAGSARPAYFEILSRSIC